MPRPNASQLAMRSGNVHVNPSARIGSGHETMMEEPCYSAITDNANGGPKSNGMK